MTYFLLYLTASNKFKCFNQGYNFISPSGLLQSNSVLPQTRIALHIAKINQAHNPTIYLKVLVLKDHCHSVHYLHVPLGGLRGKRLRESADEILL